MDLQETLTIAESLAPTAVFIKSLRFLQCGHKARWAWNNGRTGVPVMKHIVFTVNEGGPGRSTAHPTHELLPASK